MPARGARDPRAQKTGPGPGRACSFCALTWAPVRPCFHSDTSETTHPSGPRHTLHRAAGSVMEGRGAPGCGTAPTARAPRLWPSSWDPGEGGLSGPSSPTPHTPPGPPLGQLRNEAGRLLWDQPRGSLPRATARLSHSPATTLLCD